MHKKKKEVKRIYKKWEKEAMDRERYIEKKKMKELCKQKQRERRVMEENELKSLRNAVEVWKFINRKRRKKREVGGNIRMEQWMRYFRELWEGEEEDVNKLDGHLWTEEIQGVERKQGKEEVRQIEKS